SQAGTPRVQVKENWNAEKGEYALELGQTCPPTPGQPEKAPFQIPVRLGLLDHNGVELPLNNSQVRINSDGLPLVELKNTKETFVFTGLKSRPHASLLRDFSSPVNLDWERSDEELFFLMAKDTDGFNRREAAQEVAKRVLSRMIKAVREGRAPAP